ncbi:hypothetical protein LTR37_004775 [Vermiconidia calcicola]|uniref:Uncharacterized protein n=1 Tax=Vermiconidia calcicola TaxID=1690605 RepID=A0ACC3NL45_9PEZI|nr:hypothetical protein LTR37_004775 [Vermiconidia calcicola]
MSDSSGRRMSTPDLRALQQLSGSDTYILGMTAVPQMHSNGGTVSPRHPPHQRNLDTLGGGTATPASGSFTTDISKAPPASSTAQVAYRARDAHPRTDEETADRPYGSYSLRAHPDSKSPRLVFQKLGSGRKGINVLDRGHMLLLDPHPNLRSKRPVYVHNQKLSPVVEFVSAQRSPYQLSERVNARSAGNSGEENRRGKDGGRHSSEGRSSIASSSRTVGLSHRSGHGAADRANSAGNGDDTHKLPNNASLRPGNSTTTPLPSNATGANSNRSSPGLSFSGPESRMSGSHATNVIWEPTSPTASLDERGSDLASGAEETDEEGCSEGPASSHVSESSGSARGSAVGSAAGVDGEENENEGGVSDSPAGRSSTSSSSRTAESSGQRGHGAFAHGNRAASTASHALSVVTPSYSDQTGTHASRSTVSGAKSACSSPSLDSSGSVGSHATSAMRASPSPTASRTGSGSHSDSRDTESEVESPFQSTKSLRSGVTDTDGSLADVESNADEEASSTSPSSGRWTTRSSIDGADRFSSTSHSSTFDTAGCGLGDDNRLRRTLKELWRTSAFTDLIISSGAYSFPLHRCILSTQSPFFAHACRQNLQPSAKGLTLAMDSDDPIALHSMLQYFYTAKLSVPLDNLLILGGPAIPSLDILLKVYKLATKYTLPDLKEQAAEQYCAVLANEWPKGHGILLAKGLIETFNEEFEEPEVLREATLEVALRFSEELLGDRVVYDMLEGEPLRALVRRLSSSVRGSEDRSRADLSKQSSRSSADTTGNSVIGAIW